MEVTITFAALLSLFLIVLSFRVLDLRGSPVTKFFHKPNREIDPNDLERAIRGHGNLIEYAPLFLILMLALELSDASDVVVYLWNNFQFRKVHAWHSFFFYEKKCLFKNRWHDTNFHRLFYSAYSRFRNSRFLIKR